MATESLRPDKSLLDPKFEGYKLSSDQLDVNSTNLVSGVNVVSPRDDLFSLQYVRAFGRHNHLVFDQWQTSTRSDRVYYVDEDYELQQATVRGQEVESVESVFKIPSPEEMAESLNATIFFPSSNFACVGDGCGKLYVVHTEGRTEDSDAEWKVSCVYQFDRPFVILHALQAKDSGTLSCLMLSIIEKDDVISANKAHTVNLTLVVFSQVLSAGSASFTCEVVKHFQGHSAPVYGAIEPGNGALVVASERPFHLVKESEESSHGKTVVEKIPESDGTDDKEEETPDILYTWSQDEDDVTLRFDLPHGTNKEDIICNIKPEEIEVALFGGEVLLRGSLYAKVKPDECTWTRDENSLEVVLEKQVTEHHWSTVVVGDSKGKYVLLGEEAERVKEIHDRLEHLTADKLDTDPNAEHMPFNQQQLEGCDDFPEDIEYIMRLDTSTGNITHKVCLASNQWLFNTIISPDTLPVFCLRHDVDALLWQPKTVSDNNDNNWNHTGTFNALGFVQASKQNRRFSTCSPSMDYAVLCDHTRHVYVYHRANADTEIAVQQVVTLESPGDSILGLQASNQSILVLTPKSLHVITVKC